MDIFEREAIGIRGRFGVDVWEKWLSFQHSQEDFLRNYGVREDRIDGTVLALKRLLRNQGIVADKNSHRANRKVAGESHNGWTNYETWYVKAIIDNDYDLYMESKNIVNVEHLFNMVDGHPLNDLSYDEMDRVNWDELLEAFDRTANRRANRRASRKTANAELIETVELGDGFSADVWFDPDGEALVGYAYTYEVYRGGEPISIGIADTFDEAVYKAEFSAFNSDDYMNGGYGFDMPNYHSSRRANRKTAEYDPTDVFYNEGVWEVANEVWDSRLLDYDVTDEMIEEKIRDYSEFFLGQQADQTFVDMVMDILNKNRYRTSRRANRNRRTARMWQEGGETLMDYEEAVAGLSLPSGSRPRVYMDYNDQILAPKSLYYLEQYLETYGEPIRYRTTSDSMDNIADWMIRPASRRANRKRSSERMNYGTVYVVTSDGEVVEGDTPGDMEFISVHVDADDQPEVGYYDFGPIIDELYEGVVSSIGAEPVEVVPGYFVGDMGVSTDELAKFGPGEYRLCPVSLSFWSGEGEFNDLEYDDGFSYDVVVRY